ncbi:MAG: SDR family NAD(P)-dependent oxidoreductase, partial [Actinomycetota bacterium]
MIAIDHTGQVALVTGAGAGIGREIARWLARAGAHVVVTAVRGAHADSVVAEIVDDGG